MILIRTPWAPMGSRGVEMWCRSQEEDIAVDDDDDYYIDGYDDDCVVVVVVAPAAAEIDDDNVDVLRLPWVSLLLCWAGGL